MAAKAVVPPTLQQLTWGVMVDAKHEDPLAPRTLHKIDRAGCFFPASWPCCTLAQTRTYLWITESGYEVNEPIAPCCCCGPVFDCITKTYWDGSKFAPLCCLKKGIATEDDLNYCCWCINCACCYDCLIKPCFGGMVAVVWCPNGAPPPFESAAVVLRRAVDIRTPHAPGVAPLAEDDCMFKCATRCCSPCCACPVLQCVKDSKGTAALMLATQRAAHAKKVAWMAAGRPAPQTKAPEPQVMVQVP